MYTYNNNDIYIYIHTIIMIINNNNGDTAEIIETMEVALYIYRYTYIHREVDRIWHFQSES